LVERDITDGQRNAKEIDKKAGELYWWKWMLCRKMAIELALCWEMLNSGNMHMYFLLIKNVKLVERKIA